MPPTQTDSHCGAHTPPFNLTGGCSCCTTTLALGLWNFGRHRHGAVRAPAVQPFGDLCGDRGGARRQPLPLHGYAPILQSCFLFFASTRYPGIVFFLALQYIGIMRPAAPFPKTSCTAVCYLFCFCVFEVWRSLPSIQWSAPSCRSANPSHVRNTLATSIRSPPSCPSIPWDYVLVILIC